MADRNLVLIDNPRLRSPSDFVGIKERIERLAPDIGVFIVPNGHTSPVTQRAAARRPALVFCPEAVSGFRPRRGRVYQGKNLSKSEQGILLQAAGLPTPATVVVRPETRLDPAEWGPFVVLKPENAKQGQGVRLVRTRDVRWVEPSSWPVGDARHGRVLIAQQFVDTGTRARSFRVMTVFGRPVYSLASISLIPRPAFALEGVDALDLPIASNAGERQLEYNSIPEIIALGAAAYRALPEVPVHGVDILRDEMTGRLYVVEINPAGHTWHISSPYFAKARRDFGLDLYKQFDGLAVIADALIEATRANAE